MINFDEELAKYQPSLEVEQAEETIHKNDLTDVTDIIKDIINEIKNKQRLDGDIDELSKMWEPGCGE